MFHQAKNAHERQKKLFCLYQWRSFHCYLIKLTNAVPLSTCQMSYPKISILFPTDSGFVKTPNIIFVIFTFLFSPVQNYFKISFIDWTKFYYTLLCIYFVDWTIH